MDRLTHEEFRNNLNTTFWIQVDDSVTIETELTEVSDSVVSPNQERFSVIFRGPNDTFLGQGTRRFKHDQMGEFDLFVVPISRNDQGTYYEAIFNRVRKNS